MNFFGKFYFLDEMHLLNLGAFKGPNVEFVVAHLISIDIIVGLLKTFLGGRSSLNVSYRFY